MTHMNRTQSDILANMTDAQAKRVIAKFKGNPEVAERKSDAAYRAFCVAWEQVHDEYIQRHQRARIDGGVTYNYISLA